MITLKAVCIAAALTDCGIITEVFQENKSLGEGLMTFREVADTLTAETGLKSYVIPKKDFLAIFTSRAFDFDIEIVLPNDPDPQPKCNVRGDFEFVTKFILPREN